RRTGSPPRAGAGLARLVPAGGAAAPGQRGPAGLRGDGHLGGDRGGPRHHAPRPPGQVSPATPPEGTAGFVRPARAGDAEAPARLQVASWRSGFAGIVPDALLARLTSDEARARWQERWREAITRPPTSRHRVLAAVTGAPEREVAGFASAGPATDAD